MNLQTYVAVLPPPARPLLAEGSCPGCGAKMREMVTATLRHVAEVDCVRCETTFQVQLKELDS